MTPADLRLMRDGLLQLHARLVARGDRRAAEEVIACMQRITDELRKAS
jgi:hypothetical protein